jgi:hypothetical protein
MTRTALALTALTLAVTVSVSAQAKKYGTPLTLKETTKVSDIYATPEKFAGKRVRVEGPIVDVCEDMGCWLAIGSDKEFQTLRFKVEDGVIVFPMSAKGLHATLEGVIEVGKPAEDAAMAEKMKKMDPAERAKHEKEMAKVTIQIKGEGAEIR